MNTGATEGVEAMILVSPQSDGHKSILPDSRSFLLRERTSSVKLLLLYAIILKLSRPRRYASFCLATLT